ncbi:MAG TPA: VWA domain-containing protein [Caldilineae bacterium]|nr:VWA domain-containing protein [Caldilineae bacterium]
MSFLNPSALALVALALPIIALYFLKLRRQPYTVSSTYLWRRLLRDTAANAPWQRLQPNLLLLLQLLILALLVLALARPFSWTEAAAGDHVILILDTSASMQATDMAPNRLAEAVKRARRLIDALPGSARVTLIAAGSDTRVLLSGSTDRARTHEALEALSPGTGSSDLSDALNLAAAIAARERDPETIILSDGNVTLPEHLAIPGRVRYIPIGRGAAEPDAIVPNQAITALSLRPIAGGNALIAFVQVTNFGTTSIERRLSLYADGHLVAARTLSLPPERPLPLTFDDISADVSVVEARLEGEDALALDDVAWAVPPARRTLQVDLVGPGNRFLETALSLLPGLEVAAIQPRDYLSDGCPSADETCRRADITIFDNTTPEGELPPGAMLFIAPPRATSIFSVTGQLEGPVPIPAQADEPLLRYVDLRGVQIQQAFRIPLPEWARAVVVADVSTDRCEAPCPLLFVGEVEGRRVAVLTFDLRKSDLPLRVAFPILIANLMDFLSAGAGGADIPTWVRPGQPVTFHAPPEAEAILITRPDGTTERVEIEDGRAVYSDTTWLGIYEVAWVPSGMAVGQGERLLGRFAVNLFDPQESALAPKSSLPVQGTARTDIGEAGHRGRREWWRPLAWGALALLMAEWLYAHRGALSRLRGTIVALAQRPTSTHGHSGRAA